MPEHKPLYRKKTHSDEEQIVSSKKQPMPSSAPLQFQRDTSVTPHNALQLQRTLGNAAVQRLVANQPKNSDIQRLFGKKKSEAEIAKAKKEALDDKVGNALGKVKWVEDPLALQALRIFALSEYSAENVDCLLMILDYKHPSSLSRKAIVKKIQATFFGPASPQEVNITKKQIDDVVSKTSQDQYDDTLFDSIVQTLNTNLSDTTSRVHFSDTKAAQPFREYLLQAVKEQTFSFKAKKAIKKGFGAFTRGVAATMGQLSNVNPLMPF